MKIEKQMQQTELQIPKGINSLGIISVFVSVGLFLFGAVGYGQFGIQPVPLDQRLFGAFLMALSLAGLVSSLALISMRSRKQLWYVLISYWVMLLVSFTVWDLSRLDNILRAISEGYFTSSLFFLLGPIIYSAFCIAYFLTRDAKKYFHLNAQINLQS